MNKPTRKPIAVWYKATVWWNVKIRPVQVVAFTEKTVTFLDGNGINDDQPPFREIRNNISLDDSHFFPTFDEAKAWCIQKAEDKVRHAETELNRSETRLRTAKELSQ